MSSSTPFLADYDFRKEIGVISILVYYNIIGKLTANNSVLKKFPPVIASTLLILAGLNIADHGFQAKKHVKSFTNYFQPSVDFLGNWMSLWLVPSLILLPKALSKLPRASAITWIKIFVVHFGLFVGGNALNTSLFKLLSPGGWPSATVKAEEGASADSFQESAGEAAASSAADDGSKKTFQNSGNKEEDTAAANGEDRALDEPENTAPLADASQSEAQLAVLKFWTKLGVAAYAAAIVGNTTPSPAHACASIVALQGAKQLPRKVSKVLHPLIVSCVASGIMVCLFGHLRNARHGHRTQSWVDLLHDYTPANGFHPRSWLPGQVFGQLLAPSCVALAFRIFQQQEAVSEHFVPVLLSSAITAVASLFVSPAIGRVVGVPSAINQALAHRSVTSPLAIPSARACGASEELTMAAVLVTGIYGASGAWLYSRLGVGSDCMSAGDEDTQEEIDVEKVAVARGTTVGNNSHSIGTSDLLANDDKKAAGVASVSMIVAGIVHAICCSLPGVSDAVTTLSGEV